MWAAHVARSGDVAGSSPGKSNSHAGFLAPGEDGAGGIYPMPAHSGGGGGDGGGGVLAGSGHGASGTAAYVHDPPGLDLRSNRVRLSLFFWCSFAGCMAGLTSVGGPPLMIFVSLHAKEIKMDTWRGSNAVGRLLLNVARGVVFARNGSFDGYLERTAAGGQWPVGLAMIVGGWVGLLGGNQAAYLFKDAASLNRLMLVFLFFAAVLMEAAGFGDDVQRPASLGVGVLAAAMSLGVLAHAGWQRWCGHRSDATD
jgi:hypothetical protein